MINEKSIIATVFIIFIVSGVILGLLVSLPIMFNPNSGQTKEEFKTNHENLDRYINQFLENHFERINTKIGAKNEEIRSKKTLGRTAQYPTRRRLRIAVNQYNKNKYIIIKNKTRIRLLKQLIMKLAEQIRRLRILKRQAVDPSVKASIQSTINFKKQRIKEYKTRIQKANAKIQTEKAKLSKNSAKIERLNTKYHSTYKGKSKYFKHILAGFDNGVTKDEYINELRKQIDKMFLLEVNSFVRPDLKLKDEDITAKFKNDELTVNSKEVIKEVLKEHIQSKSFNRYIFKEGKSLEYERKIKIFRGFKSMEAYTPVYRIETINIPYYYTQKIHNYYVDNDYAAIIERLMDKDTKFKEIAEARGMSTNEVIDHFHSNMKQNWITKISHKDYTNYKHFEEKTEDVKDREMINRNELLSRAKNFKEQFNNSGLKYIPKQEMIGNNLRELSENLSISPTDNLDLVKKPEKVLKKIPKNYITTTKSESEIWVKTNNLKEDYLTTIENTDSLSKKRLVTEINDRTGEHIYPAGLGHIGFLQYLFLNNDRVNDFEDLYLESTPLYSEDELKKGDLAFYYNPETKKTINAFGVYAGKNKFGNPLFYHFNFYDDNEVKVVKDTADFNIYMRYYPVKEETENE